MLNHDVKCLHSIISYTVNEKNGECEVGEWPRMGEKLQTGERKETPPQYKQSTSQFYHCLSWHSFIFWLASDLPFFPVRGQSYILCVPEACGVLRAEMIWVIPAEPKEDVIGRKARWDIWPRCCVHREAQTKNLGFCFSFLKYPNCPQI